MRGSTDTLCLRTPLCEPGDFPQSQSLASYWRDLRTRVDPVHSPEDFKLRVGTDCSICSRSGATPMGQVFGHAWVLRQCVCNVVSAVCSRHGALAPVPTREVPFPGGFVDCLRAEYGLHILPVSRAWPKKWPFNKFLAFLRSIATERHLPGRVKVFIKREMYHKIPSKARLIQGYANLTTQELFARQFTALQKALNSVASLNGFEVYPGILITVSSGFNSRELGRWMEIHWRPGRVLYERDGANWDSTMSAVIILAKNRIFSDVTGDAEFSKFLADCFATSAAYLCRNTRSRFQFSLLGTVRSGHNDTTSANSMINAMLTAAALRDQGLTGSIIVAGDDCLASIDGDFDLAALKDVESQFGIVPEAAKFSSPLSVTFCSGCWLPAGCGWRYVPLLGRLLKRLFWTCNPPGSRNRANYMYSVCTGVLTTTSGLPIYTEFLETHRGFGRLIETEYQRDSRYNSCDFTGVGWDSTTVEALLRKYDLTLNEVADLCGFILKSGPTPARLCHPVAAKIIAYDLADVTVRPDRGCHVPTTS